MVALEGILILSCMCLFNLYFTVVAVEQAGREGRGKETTKGTKGNGREEER